jgi:CRP-like cAMP-binding protein
MSVNRRAALLVREMPLFADLTPKEVVLLGMVLKERDYQAGDWLCREGEPGDGCFFIGEGEVEIIKRAANQAQAVIGRAGKHATVGQISLIDDGPRSASVRAKTRVEVLRLDRGDFEALQASGSQFAYRFQLAIARSAAAQLREANQTLMGLMQQRETPSGSMQRVTLQKVQAVLAHTRDLHPVPPKAEGEA